VRPGADYYVEYGFTTAAGDLAPATSVEVRVNSRKDDWLEFDETNDYSYGEPSSFTDWPQITAYRNGVLVWGVEP
jgi:cellulose 1,4-beta-cellobiosidase